MALTDAKRRFPLVFRGAIFPVAASLDAKWNTCRGKCTSSFHATFTVSSSSSCSFFTVPPMCQVVAIVFRLSLSTYFLPPLRILSVFLCFPLFNGECITGFLYRAVSVFRLILSGTLNFDYECIFESRKIIVKGT